jgi:enoyl-CoA hydratase/carnithine racemase
MAEELLYEKADHVAWLTLNRPERMNALSRALKDAIIEAAVDASTDPEVWAVVVRGHGGKAFCVGADLKEMAASDAAGRRLTSPMLEPARNVYEAVLEIPKPTIAVVGGYALGGGFELAMACDLRVASEQAVFGLPESTLGMGANFGSVLLPRLIPRTLAMELLYFGRRVPAAELARYGLLNHVWPAGELDERAGAWVAELVTRAPLTLQRYKQMALRGWEMPVPAHLRLDAGPNPYTSQDRIEGTSAYREKRVPRWQAR